MATSSPRSMRARPVRRTPASVPAATTPQPSASSGPSAPAGQPATAADPQLDAQLGAVNGLLGQLDDESGKADQSPQDADS